MKITFTKTDFAENGGKLFLSYLENIFKWESNTKNKSLFMTGGTPISMKLKGTPKNKDKDKMEKIKSFNAKIDTIRNLKLLTEQIVGKILSDSGVTLEGNSLQAAKKKIQSKFISKDSVEDNFEVDIEFDCDTGRCNFIPKKVPEVKPKLEMDQSMELDVESKHEVTKKIDSESKDKENKKQSTASKADDSDEIDVEMEPEKIEKTTNAADGNTADGDIPMISKKVSDEKPKLELDQSMEFDFEPNHEPTKKPELEAAEEKKPADSKGDVSDETNVGMDSEEIEESKKPVDGDSTDTDVMIKDQSSAYSPSHLSEELRNEASTKHPELKKETKSSEDGKTKVEESSPNSVLSSENTHTQLFNTSFNREENSSLLEESRASWKSFLNDAESVPRSSQLHAKFTDRDDGQTTHFESEMEGTTESLKEDSNDSRTETAGNIKTDSLEKAQLSSDSETSEQTLNKVDVFLPEDVSLATVEVQRSLSQDANKKENLCAEDGPILGESMGISSAPAQINE